MIMPHKRDTGQHWLEDHNNVNLPIPLQSKFLYRIMIGAGAWPGEGDWAESGDVVGQKFVGRLVDDATHRGRTPAIMIVVIDNDH